MKVTKMTRNFFSAALLSTVVFMSACSDDPITPVEQPDDDLIVLSEDISTRTLSANEKYLLRGQVFVRSGQVLTIEPGTVILGEKSSKGTLIIDRGAQIIANGTRENPIVFTSNQAAGDRDKGDWGGLVLLGRARVNLPSPAIEGITPQVVYGGEDDNDNTGSLQFVRVEFAGIELTPNNETNGITLGAVGRGTTFENIQVSYGGDDGIEWFGGSVNGKYLIVFGTWDDCFDIDNGFSGNLQFGLSVRYPSYADQSDSNGFEWDTDGDNDLTRFRTTAVASNFTVLGPRIDGSSISANFKHAIDFRRNIAGSIFNSVFVGFPTGVRFNQASVFPNYDGAPATDKGIIANNIIYAQTTAILSGNTTYPAADIAAYLAANDNIVEAGADFQTTAAYTALGLKEDWFFGRTRTNTQYPAHPSFTVTAGTLASGAKFDYAKLNEEGRADQFDKTVTFRGAFGATDWTAGWTHFDPINAAY